MSNLIAEGMKIDGWITTPEGEFLYSLARLCRSGCIVEIGSWKGRSTYYLGMGSRHGKQPKVYAVDHFKGTPESGPTLTEFLNNMERAGLSDLVVPIVEYSADAAKDFNEPIGVLFIDGDHGYESVKQDYELWSPKVIKDGWIVFHDFRNEPGVRQVIIENGLVGVVADAVYAYAKVRS